MAGVTVLVTHKRVKNVNFRIGSDGVARMSVPLRMSRERAAQVARDHASWFVEHAERARQRRPTRPRGWETGDALRVWGDELVLRIDEASGRFGCSRVGDCLEVRVPAGSTPEGRAAMVERWLAQQLREALLTLLPACEERVGRRAAGITLRRMKSRWGSCTPRTGRIRLNTALAECPPACLKMVLVHELCHLIEPSHGPRFHALMDLHCPDWRVTQRWLDEHPPA